MKRAMRSLSASGVCIGAWQSPQNDDGEIIGSTIGIVYNAYKKLNEQEFVIDELIELDAVNPVFEKQKIESICITNHSENKYTCTLVADNDDGKSVLFEVEITI